MKFVWFKDLSESGLLYDICEYVRPFLLQDKHFLYVIKIDLIHPSKFIAIKHIIIPYYTSIAIFCSIWPLFTPLHTLIQQKIKNDRLVGGFLLAKAGHEALMERKIRNSGASTAKSFTQETALLSNFRLEHFQHLFYTVSQRNLGRLHILILWHMQSLISSPEPIYIRYKVYICFRHPLRKLNFARYIWQAKYNYRRTRELNVHWKQLFI